MLVRVGRGSWLLFGLFAKNKFGREKILNWDGGSISQDGRRTRKVDFLNLPEQSGRTEVTRRHLTKIMSSVCGRMEASQLSLSSNKQPNEGFVSNKVGCISILNSSIVNDSLSYSVITSVEMFRTRARCRWASINYITFSKFYFLDWSKYRPWTKKPIIGCKTWFLVSENDL